MTTDTMTPYKSAYEVLPEIVADSLDNALLASYTPNNGIRIGIRFTDEADQHDDFPDWMEFDFNCVQAELIGKALLRWVDDNKREIEFMRGQLKTP